MLGTGTDLALVAGAARGAASRGDAALGALGRYLVDVDPESPQPVAMAAGIALTSRDVADRVPFRSLLRLAENGGPLAAAAARALPRRDDGTASERIRALLTGTDASVRLSVALGYGEAEEAASVSVLARRYHVEEDPRVRRAIVRALAMRTEPQRTAILELAASTDPDAEARRVARRALGGKRALAPNLLERGTATLFRIDAAGAPSPHLRLVLPSGMSVSVVPAADGGLLLGGMPFGAASIQLDEAPLHAIRTEEQP